MRILALLIPAAALLGCGETDRASAGSTIYIGSAEQYEALPMRALSADAPLCASSAETCLVPPRGSGAVSEYGDVVVLVAGGRRPLVALVRRGVAAATILGRDGGGPGEYQIPGLLGFAPNGDVLVFDLLSRRRVQFAPDGTPRGTGTVTLPPAPVQSASAFAFVGGELRMLAGDRADAKGDTLPVHVFALDSGAAAARLLRTLDLRLPAYGLGAFFAMPPLFTPTVDAVQREDGRVLFSRGERLELEVFDSAGRHEMRVGYAIVGRPVTAEDVEAERQRRLRGAPSAQFRAMMEGQMKAAAARHPAVTRLVAMGRQETWIRRTPDAASDSVEWLILDRDLAPVARVVTGAQDDPIGVYDGRYLLARAGDDEATTGYWWMRTR